MLHYIFQILKWLNQVTITKNAGAVVSNINIGNIPGCLLTYIVLTIFVKTFALIMKVLCTAHPQDSFLVFIATFPNDPYFT